MKIKQNLKRDKNYTSYSMQSLHILNHIVWSLTRHHMVTYWTPYGHLESELFDGLG